MLAPGSAQDSLAYCLGLSPPARLLLLTRLSEQCLGEGGLASSLSVVPEQIDLCSQAPSQGRESAHSKWSRGPAKVSGKENISPWRGRGGGGGERGGGREEEGEEGQEVEAWEGEEEEEGKQRRGERKREVREEAEEGGGEGRGDRFG